MALYETRDVKNTPVFADIRNVSGTRWSVITKIDQKPVFAPLKKRAANILILLSAFLVIVVGSGVLIWKNQQLYYYRNLYIALLSADGKMLTFPYFIDEKEAPPEPGPLGNGLTEFVLRTGKPLLVRPEDTEYMVNAT